MLEHLWSAVSRRRRLCAVLQLVSHAVVLCAAVALCAVAWLGVWEHLLGTAMLLGTLGVGFVAVTLWRHLVPSLRPYECYPEAFSVLPREKCGHAFPSRHAFCAFAIGAAACAVSLPIGIPMLTLAVAQAVARVLLGIHFPRDTAVGAAVGVLFGAVAALTYIWLG